MESLIPSLPDKPSAILKHALKDLDAVSQDPHYEIDMSEWHTPKRVGLCKVCFAGAVIANTLKVETDVRISPEFFSSTIEAKLFFMERVRESDILGGAKRLFTQQILSTEEYARAVELFTSSTLIGMPKEAADYHPEFRAQFKQYIQLVADLFRSIDL